MSLRSPRFALVVGLIFTLSLVAYFDRNLLGIVSPAVKKEFEFSEATMGWIFFAFRIPYALMNLVGGILSDRFGPRIVLGTVAVGSALFTALFALAGGGALAAMFGAAGSFMALRAAAGVFQGPLYPSLARVNASWTPVACRSSVQGLIAAGAGIGGAATALVPLVFESLDQTRWRVMFVAAGIGTLLFALLWFALYRNRPVEIAAKSPSPKTDDEPAPARPLWQTLLGNRNLLLLTLAYFTNCYFVYVFFDWTKYYCKEVRAFTEDESNWATFGVWMGWVVFSPLGGWMSDQLVRRLGVTRGLRLVPMCSLTASALLLGAASRAADHTVIVVLMGLSLGLASAADAPFWTAAIHAGGRNAGAACGLFNTIGNLGGIGTPLTAFVAGHLGWTWGLASASAVLFAGLLVWPLVKLEESAES